MASQASFESVFQQRSDKFNDDLLFQANCGTVYASRSDGSKAFAVLVFRALGNSSFSRADYSVSLRLQLLGFYFCDP